MEETNPVLVGVFCHTGSNFASVMTYSGAGFFTEDWLQKFNDKIMERSILDPLCLDVVDSVG